MESGMSALARSVDTSRKKLAEKQSTLLEARKALLVAKKNVISANSASSRSQAELAVLDAESAVLDAENSAALQSGQCTEQKEMFDMMMKAQQGFHSSLMNLGR
jgi:hypothetical protein